MDINLIKKNLKEEYNCELIDIISYANKNFIKGLESIGAMICYRYFLVKKNNDLEEIVDELLLEYFRKNNEINENIVY